MSRLVVIERRTERSTASITRMDCQASAATTSGRPLPSRSAIRTSRPKPVGLTHWTAWVRPSRTHPVPDRPATTISGAGSSSAFPTATSPPA